MASKMKAKSSMNKEHKLWEKASIMDLTKSEKQAVWKNITTYYTDKIAKLEKPLGKNSNMLTIPHKEFVRLSKLAYEQGKKDGIKKVYTLWKETKSYKDAGNRVVVFDTDLKRLAGS